MTDYTVGTGFSGIGVPDLCARLLGMRTVWQIEKEPFCQKVLRKNFPEVETLYGDIFDVHHPAHVDLGVFGFPCQPFSIAGKQLAEKDERFLIPEMLRVIDECRPRVVLLENVPRIASLNDGNTFKNLLEALAQMGFDAEWGHIAASDVGAPHTRERWFLVAYADSSGRRQGRDYRGERHLLRDINRNAAQGQPERQGWQRGAGAVGTDSTMADAFSRGHRFGTSSDNQRLHFGNRNSAPQKPRRHKLQSRPESYGCVVGNAHDAGRREQRGTVPVRAKQPAAQRASWENRSEIKPRLGRVIDGSASWMDGFTAYPARPGMAQFTFESPRITSDYDTRPARLKALGNSMAVDVIFEIMLSIRTWMEALDAGEQGAA